MILSIEIFEHPPAAGPIGESALADHPDPDHSPFSREQRLPVSLSEFFGREDELATIKAWMNDGRARHITILGPGGVGKTRLALEVARATNAVYADGVCFIELGTLQHSNLVLSTLVRALAPEARVQDLSIDTLIESIRTRRQLVILDCFEPVIEAAALLPSILSNCPGITILTTSRERLQVSGEREFLLGPLPVPAATDTADPDAMLAFPSVRLLIDRAKSVDAELVIGADNAGLLAAICQRLEGLPLAIELAASRCAHVSPNALLPLLAQRLPMLVGGTRESPDRHRTMRDAIRWSVELLSTREQEVFRRLAAFAGRFSLSAASGVIGEDRGDPPTVLGELSALVDKSLLRREVDIAGDPCFSMLDTIREYASSLLQRAGEEAVVSRAVDAHFHHLASDLSSTPPGSIEESQAVLRLETGIATVRSWLTRLESESPAEGLLMALVDLNRFWRIASRQPEGLDWFGKAFRMTEATPSQIRARALESCGHLLRDTGQHARALKIFAEALEVYEAVHDPAGASRALNSLGAISSDLGDSAQARKHNEAALALQRKSDDRWGIARSLHNLGWVAIEEARSGEAGALFDESLRLWMETGDLDTSGRVCNSLGALTSMEGDFAAAIAHYRRSIDLYRQIGADYLLAESLSDLAAAETPMRRHAEAAQHLLESLLIYQRIGIRFRFAEAIESTAALALAMNRFTFALRLLDAAVAVRHSTGLIPVGTWRDRLASWRAEAERSVGQVARPTGEAEISSSQMLAEAIEFVQGIGGVASKRAAGKSALSRRETEVVTLIAAGKSDQEIADALFISRRTASNHAASIMQKLGAPSRAGAAVIAVRDGLI